MQMAQYPKYESYKDSGEGWIGSCPNHWETWKLKYLFREKRHRANMDLNCGAISFGEVVEKDDERVPLATKASYQEVLAGEFLVNPLNLNYDLKSLRIGLSEIDVVVSAGYIVLQATGEELDKRYYKYLLHRYDVANMKLFGSGVRQTINFNHIANSILLAPSLEEQKQIARFLDEKTAKIEEAISIKEQQIALLKERKQIIIQEAVTKGLNPNAPMKDSGINWIGEIPAHWEVKRLKYLLSESLKYGANEEATEFVEGDPRYIRITDFGSNGKLRIETQRTLPWKIANDYLLEPGDILLARSGGTVGKAYKFRDDITACFAGYLIRARTDRKKISPEYLYYFLKSPSFDRWKEAIFSRATIQNIGADKYAVLNLPVPSLQEQTAILRHLDDSEAKIDDGIAIKERQIETMKEYKTSLINEAVTGKVKVF